ncbi:MAG: caspase family protein [Gemmatimonadetes bacterium]|nr:caspase family protein [Gemmatimonadota bacterium]
MLRVRRSFALAFLLLAATAVRPEPADAQILKRMKERLQEKAGQKADTLVDKAVDAAAKPLLGGGEKATPAQPAAPAPPAPAAAGTGAEPVIDILEPSEWAGGGNRGISIAPKRSILVRGTVRHAGGITDVRINGARAAFTVDPSGMAASFSGYAPVAADTRQVEIAARGADGRVASRNFPVQPAAAAAPTVAAAAADAGGLRGFKGRRWAVVIGVSDYKDPAIPDLRYADEDARAVYDFLRSPEAGLGGIPAENILLLLDQQATARSIRSALLTFLKQSTEDDVIFIYLAGHGMPDPQRLNDLYILAYDTELADLAATGVPMEDINQAITKAYARSKILFTDACHSAGVGAGGSRAVNINQINGLFLDAMSTSSGGFVAFTASEAAQLSQEGAEWGGGHGVYTHFLLEGLRGDADEDKDYIVTLGELMEYTRDRVRRATRNAQIPTISLTTYDRYWPMAITTR